MSPYVRAIRKRYVQEYGMSAHAKYVDVAREVILRRNLFADFPQTKESAAKFLSALTMLEELQTVRPIPPGFTREMVGLK